jgi:hypothetical protein
LLESLAAGFLSRVGSAGACFFQQPNGPDLLVFGAAAGDDTLTNAGWTAVDNGFSKQLNVAVPTDKINCLGTWLSQLVHAIWVLGDDPNLASAMAPRLVQLKPLLEQAADWLGAPAQVSLIYSTSGKVPSYLVTYGSAIALTGKMVGRGDLQKIGADMIASALTLQRADGAFLMQASPTGPIGQDSWYHASALWRLAWYARRVPSPTLSDSVQRAGQWLQGEIDPDGVVLATGNVRTGICPANAGTSCAPVRYEEVALALIYASPDNQPIIDLAALVMSTQQTTSR